jgi:hypothetical protein
MAIMLCRNMKLPPSGMTKHTTKKEGNELR